MFERIGIADSIYKDVVEPSHKKYQGRCQPRWLQNAKERRIHLIKYLLWDEWERWQAHKKIFRLPKG